jgi:protoporphyrinogen oxidase
LDKFRLGLTIFRAARVKNWKPLERIPVTRWLRRWSGRKTVEKIWLPLLRAKLGDNYRETSAAFIWATIARMYAARRTGLKKEMFGYVPGGYARILDRFADQLAEDNVDVLLAHAVRRVTPAPGGGVTIELHGAPAEHFDRVVLTSAAPVIARICAGLSREEKQRLQGIRYQGIVCASVLLDRPLADYYVTNITEPWVPFTAVIEMTSLVDRRHLGGRALIYLPKYLPAEDTAFDVPDQEIEAEFLSALARMYPDFRREHVLAFRVSRVRNVMAVPTLDYSERLPPMATSLPGVYAVTSAHIVNSTLNVNETVRLAERAVEKVLLPRTGPDTESPTGPGEYAAANRQLVAGPR